MILHKILSEEEVLEIVAAVVSKYLPEDVLDSDAEIKLTFLADHSVEIYVVNLPEGEDKVLS